MYTLIRSIEQIQNLNVNSIILNHPTNDGEASTNPTGREKNSNTYKLLSITKHTLTDFDIILEPLINNNIIGGYEVTSMKKLINSDQLLNEKWRIK